MRDYLNIVFLLISSTVAIQMNEYLIKKGFDTLSSLLVAAVLALAVHQVLDVLFLKLPLRSRTLRYFIDPRSRWEGNWLTKQDNIPERPYSYATIEYNPHSKNYMYYGSGFDSEGKLRVTWKSTNTESDLNRNQLWFFFDAQMRDENAEVLRGYGVLEFEKGEAGRFTRGRGFFVDSGTTFAKSHFLLDRLEKEQVKSLIGKSSVQTNADLESLIKAFFEIPSKR